MSVHYGFGSIGQPQHDLFYYWHRNRVKTFLLPNIIIQHSVTGTNLLIKEVEDVTDCFCCLTFWCSKIIPQVGYFGLGCCIINGTHKQSYITGIAAHRLKSIMKKTHMDLQLHLTVEQYRYALCTTTINNIILWTNTHTLGATNWWLLGFSIPAIRRAKNMSISAPAPISQYIYCGIVW